MAIKIDNQEIRRLLPIVISWIVFSLFAYLLYRYIYQAENSIIDVIKLTNSNNFILIGMIVFPFFIVILTVLLKIRIEKDEDSSFYSFVELPKELKTSIQQYLTFFKDYVEVAKKEDIDFEIVQVEGGLQIKTSKKDNKALENMQDWFDEYISFIKTNVENITINVNEEASSKEIDLLRVKLENQVNNLRNSLKIAELENHYLKNDNQFLKNLALTFSSKDNVIHNQYIQGGNQQFASQIDNKNLKK